MNVDLRRAIPKAITVAMLLLVTVAPTARAQLVLEGTGAVVREGDTLVLLVGTRTYTVRLAAIDAPERGQPFWTQSRQALAGLVLNKPARVVEFHRDAEGRIVGRAFTNGTQIDEEMVRLGMAWVSRDYNRDAGLLELERIARGARRGLWADANPVPPWEWRRPR